MWMSVPTRRIEIDGWDRHLTTDEGLTVKQQKKVDKQLCVVRVQDLGTQMSFCEPLFPSSSQLIPVPPATQNSWAHQSCTHAAEHRSKFNRFTEVLLCRSSFCLGACQDRSKFYRKHWPTSPMFLWNHLCPFNTTTLNILQQWDTTIKCFMI